MVLNLLFPHKCVLCRKVLSDKEIDICNECRKDIPEFSHPSNRIPFVEDWTALWYYKDVRHSIFRFKFRNTRSYADVYARQLALKLMTRPETYDYITWVPVSFRRRLKRGYDQVALIAKALSKEMGIPVVSTLRKKRHNMPQSTISDDSQRRANVLGVYRVNPKAPIAGKQILLIDDVITTGATCSECARTLLTAGASRVYCAAIAGTDHHKK